MALVSIKSGGSDRPSAFRFMDGSIDLDNLFGSALSIP